MKSNNRTVLVTGGAGYVGSRLVPELLLAGFNVRVLDTFWYGPLDPNPQENESSFSQIIGDIRDHKAVSLALEGVTDVIHLACISNDPSYDLDPKLGKSINLDSFWPLVRAAKDKGVQRFVYASSSSVYGVKTEDQVVESLALEPLTDYSKFKAECEDILIKSTEPGFVTTVLRPATICGPAPRQRMDLTVNLLTNHAFSSGTVRVFGGNQFRPNLHIRDMCRAYIEVLNQSAHKVSGEVFNIGTDNLTVLSIAELVRARFPKEIELVIEPTLDNRSYRISSDHIADKIGFFPEFSVENAIDDLIEWFNAGLFPNSMTESKYFNIARMKEVIPSISRKI